MDYDDDGEDWSVEMDGQLLGCLIAVTISLWLRRRPNKAQKFTESRVSRVGGNGVEIKMA